MFFLCFSNSFANQDEIKKMIKKNDLILTGAYGFPVPINNKTSVKVTSSAFGDVEAKFN